MNIKLISMKQFILVLIGRTIVFICFKTLLIVYGNKMIIDSIEINHNNNIFIVFINNKFMYILYF